MNFGAKILTLVILLTDWSVGGEVVRQPPQCTVDGVTYEDGASWPSLDGCQQCRCSSGLTFCVRVSFCRDLGQCGVAITPPGSCCPVCYGCVSPSGKKVSLNETWMEDDCTTCVCRDGQTKCQASFCRTPCLYPRKVPGECCPVCDDECHLQCNYGRVVDSSGRELCQCRKVPDEDFRDLSAVTIRRKEEEEDDDEEDEDYVTSVNNSNNENEAISCPKVPCKKMCTHGFQTDGRGCPVCKCQRCPSIQPCHKKCPLGLVHDSRGCPACQCRSTTTTPAPRMCTGPANKTYNYGEKWQTDDCTRCVCNPEGSSCTKVDCPLSCLNPVFISGQCCPVCDDEASTVGQQNRNIIEEEDGGDRDGMSSSDGTALLTAILVCVSLVAGLILIVAVLAFCVARQCQRLRLHEENMASAAAAAVKLTAVNRLRPKSTNLDYQYNLYLHRYRETSPSCWTPLDVTDRSDDSSESRGDKDEGVGDSQCSNTSLLLVKSDVE